MDTPTMFQSHIVKAFMENIADIPATEQAAIQNGTRFVGELEYYKKVEITGASGRFDLFKPSDLYEDGVNIFAVGNKIPSQGSICIDHIKLSHAFNASNTDPIPKNLLFQNGITFYQSATNPAAGTANVTTLIEDDSTSVLRVPKELLSADFTLSLNNKEIFRKTVREMFFDTRFHHQVVEKGYKLVRPLMLPADALISAQFIFPKGVTVPSTSVYHWVELRISGAGTKVKG